METKGAKMDWSDRIGRRIRLRDLHVVIAVADAGSMTKASQKLAISHPVVSKTVSDLEHTLGVKLFDSKLARGGSHQLRGGPAQMRRQRLR